MRLSASAMSVFIFRLCVAKSFQLLTCEMIVKEVSRRMYKAINVGHTSAETAENRE